MCAAKKVRTRVALFLSIIFILNSLGTVAAAIVQYGQPDQYAPQQSTYDDCACHGTKKHILFSDLVGSGIDLSMLICALVERAHDRGMLTTIPYELFDAYIMIRTGRQYLHEDVLTALAPLLEDEQFSMFFDGDEQVMYRDLPREGTILGDMATSMKEFCLQILATYRDTATALAYGYMNASLMSHEGTWTILHAVDSEFEQTWTVLAGIDTDLDGVATSLSDIKNTIVTDFNGTWTTQNAINNNVINDFNATWTMIEAADSLVGKFFNQTWTILNNLDNEFAHTWTILSDIKNTIVADFSATWTMIESESNLLAKKFDQTWTLLGGTTESIANPTGIVELCNTSGAKNLVVSGDLPDFVYTHQGAVACNSVTVDTAHAFNNIDVTSASAMKWLKMIYILVRNINNELRSNLGSSTTSIPNL